MTINPLTPVQGYRNNDRDTSVSAFTKQNQKKLSDRMLRILTYIAAKGAAGATDYDIRTLFGPDDPESSWRKRRSDLTARGLVVDSGRREIRDGSSVIVWVVKGTPLPKPSETV
jgi:hypothetical protein